VTDTLQLFTVGVPRNRGERRKNKSASSWYPPKVYAGQDTTGHMKDLEAEWARQMPQ
jgi:hypothetical protein